MATARPALETADERLRPRQSNFGSLGAGMIERGKVPAHILYGAESAESEAPADGIIDVNVAAAAAASLLQLRALASAPPRPAPRAVEPALPVEPPLQTPPIQVVEQPEDPPATPVDVVNKAAAEILAIEERVRPRQSNFGSLGASMIERGNVPAHILYGGPLSAAQIELLLNPDVVVAPAASPSDAGEQPEDAGTLAAAPVDRPDVPAVSPEAIVATGPAAADYVAAVADNSASAPAVESIEALAITEPDVQPVAEIEPMAPEPVAPLVLDVAPDADDDATRGAPRSHGHDDTMLPAVLSQPADPTVESPAESTPAIAVPALRPALEPIATPVAEAPRAEIATVVALAPPSATSVALVPVEPARRKRPTSLYVAIGFAEAAVLALVCGWIAWRAPDPSTTAAMEPPAATNAPLAESSAPANMPAVEQAEPPTIAATAESPAAVVATTQVLAETTPAPVVEQAAARPVPAILRDEPLLPPVVMPPLAQFPAAPVVVEQAPAPVVVPPPAPPKVAPVVVELTLPPVVMPPLAQFPAAPVMVEQVPAPAVVPPSAPPPVVSAPVVSAVIAQAAAPAVVPPPAAEPPAAASAGTEQSADLLRRGDEYLRNGDVVTARLFYERSAELGDFQAMMALGQTYDPVLLKRLGARGIVADQKLAERWYAKAAEAQARGPAGAAR